MTSDKTRIGLFLFTNDLRLHDNPALQRAATVVDKLVCVYIHDKHWQSNSQYLFNSNNKNSERFLNQTLWDLSGKLNKLGQQLFVLDSLSSVALNNAIDSFNVSDVFRSDNVGWYENRAWSTVQKSYPSITYHSIDTHTLFSQSSLPFDASELPSSFTKFKNAVSDVDVTKPITTIDWLPEQAKTNNVHFHTITRQLSKPSITAAKNSQLQGGESHGLAQLKAYFGSEKPMFYKEHRNEIDGWENSCKFSPWLANGSLSVRQIVSELTNFENNITANESTYWIYFELLWREYFQWYAVKHGSTLFTITGPKGKTFFNSFYPERFQKWVNGTTPYPLVNACMKELKETGYLSNRGRQIVASCFVNELALDWRYGAAYFEQVLVDFDVASNWGNWQYLAGVGADTRDRRHFNLEKQTQQYDPSGRYVKLWQCDQKNTPLDSVDAADWPIA